MKETDDALDDWKPGEEAECDACRLRIVEGALLLLIPEAKKRLTPERRARVERAIAAFTHERRDLMGFAPGLLPPPVLPPTIGMRM